MPTQESLIQACIKYDAMGLDVSSVLEQALRMDTPCGRGWEGTKPGCVRKKKAGTTAASTETSKRPSKEERDKAKLAEMHKKQFVANIAYGHGGVSADTSEKDRAKLAKIRARDVANTDVAKQHGLTAAEIEGILRKKYGLDGGLKKRGFSKEEQNARLSVALSKL